MEQASGSEPPVHPVVTTAEALATAEAQWRSAMAERDELARRLAMAEERERRAEAGRQQLAAALTEAQRASSASGSGVAASLAAPREVSQSGGAFLPAPSRLPKVPMYSGSERELETWLSQARAIMDADPCRDLQSPEIVGYAVLFLEKRARQAWDFLSRTRGDARCGCRNFEDFARELRKLLGPAHSDITARQALRNLRQRRGKRSMKEYVDKFLSLVRSMETPTGDLDLREAFVGGLQTDARVYVRHSPNMVTCQDAIAAALLWARTVAEEEGAPTWTEREGRSDGPRPMDLGVLSLASSSRSRSSSRSKSPGRRQMSPARSQSTYSRGGGGSAAQRAGSPAARPKRWPRLSDAERAKCLEDGLCFRCRKPGHVSWQCPEYPSSGKN